MRSWDIIFSEASVLIHVVIGSVGGQLLQNGHFLRIIVNELIVLQNHSDQLESIQKYQRDVHLFPF